MALGGQARAKFLCDAERCIECNACVTACKNEHEVPWGINRRRVVTTNDGSPVELARDQIAIPIYKLKVIPTKIHVQV